MPRGIPNKGPAVRGQRIVLPMVATPPAPSATYVCGHKPLPIGSRVLYQGVEVPDADTWTRVEAWVSSRRIRKIEPGEVFVSYEDFCKTWDKEHGVQEELPLEFASKE